MRERGYSDREKIRHLFRTQPYSAKRALDAPGWLLDSVANENGQGQNIGMIGLIIVTHAGLASEFRAALEHIVGPQEQLVAVSISPDDDMALRRREILDAVAKIDSGDGVVILTDMFGGTPSNLAISVLDDVNVEVIAGINLPLLVKLAQVRGEKSLAEAVEVASDAGRKYIKVASQELSGPSRTTAAK